MLINKTYHDLPTTLHKNGNPIRIFIISPVVPDYPHAKFPGFGHSLRNISFMSTNILKVLWSLGTFLRKIEVRGTL